jgi:hypothetical protein
VDTARAELHAMLEEEDLRDAILLVFANKQDMKGACAAAEGWWGGLPAAQLTLTAPHARPDPPRPGPHPALSQARCTRRSCRTRWGWRR